MTSHKGLSWDRCCSQCTLYVNNLPSTVQSCKPECYVDDSKLYISYPTNEIENAITFLNKDLNRICIWCCQNTLFINPDKTKVIAFGSWQCLQKLPDFLSNFLGKTKTRFLLLKIWVYTWTHLSCIRKISQTLFPCACINYCRIYLGFGGIFQHSMF